MKIIDPIQKRAAPRGVILTHTPPEADASQLHTHGEGRAGSMLHWSHYLSLPVVYSTVGCIAGTVLLLVGLVSYAGSLRQSYYEARIRSAWDGSVATDLVEDIVALEAKVTLRTFGSRNVQRAAPVTRESPVRTVSAPISRKRSPQQLTSQVLRIITGTNKRQTQSKRLASAIVAESIRQGYDPLFVAAVIKSESAFNEMAVSHKGALGLMQIMPATGKYLADKNNVAWPAPAKLSEAGYNLHLGISYLKQLEQMYQGNRLLTLIAYNWGPGKLDRAIRSGRGVPAECLRYALKILRDHHVWESDAQPYIG